MLISNKCSVYGQFKVVKITYLDHLGSETVADVREGMTVMHGAVNNGIEGIEGECGGCCSCATCHVYVDPRFADMLDAPDEFENALLDGVASPRKPNSRLSCQINIRPELDGMIVEMPETQY